MRVSIAGSPYPFVLDTGATVDTYDSILLPAMGAPVDAGDHYSGSPPFDFYWPPEATVGPLRVSATMPVAAIDLSHLREASQKDFFGVIGVATLERYILVLDYEEGVAQLLAPGSPLHFESEYECGLVRDPFRRYTVELEIAPGFKRRFLVDTAQDGAGSMTSALIDSLLAAGHGISITGETEVIGVEGKEIRRECLVDTVRFGGFVHRRVRFNESQDNAIGRDMLCRYVTILDFPERRAYFRRGSRHDLPDRYDSPLVSLEPAGGGMVVTDVIRGGVADVSGLQVGDVILAVGNSSVDGVPVDVVADALHVRSGRERSVELTVRRAGADDTLTVVLDARLDVPAGFRQPSD